MNHTVPMLFRGLSFVLLMLVGSSGFAQEVTVRVINAANGHPLAQAPVHVWAFTKGGQRLTLKTDANGEARFKLPDPAPAWIRVDVVPSRILWDCGCFGAGATADVIQKGIVELHNGNIFHDNRPTRFTASLKPTPGQILIPIRHLSFFEQLYMATVGG